jgi:hypothetical protein
LFAVPQEPNIGGSIGARTVTSPLSPSVAERAVPVILNVSVVIGVPAEVTIVRNLEV